MPSMAQDGVIQYSLHALRWLSNPIAPRIDPEDVDECHRPIEFWQRAMPQVNRIEIAQFPYFP